MPHDNRGALVVDRELRGALVRDVVVSPDDHLPGVTMLNIGDDFWAPMGPLGPNIHMPCLTGFHERSMVVFYTAIIEIDDVDVNALVRFIADVK